MTKPPLTKRKAKWPKNIDTTLKGTKLSYNASIQHKYERYLNKITQSMIKDAHKSIVDLFKSPVGVDFYKSQQKAAAMDDSLGSQARILMNALMSKYTQLFDKKSKTLSQWMLDSTLKYSKSTLHASLKQLSGGLSLKTGVVPKGLEDVAKATIEENVSLIRSIPSKFFELVSGSVYRSITTGQGLKDLVPSIEKYSGQTTRRAKNIALDQTRKAYNTINKQRMQAVNVKQFEWIHSYGGQSPRESHIKIDGVVFDFDKLEEQQAKLGVPQSDRGLPGIPINCRCTMVPVIDFSEN